jgi:hypothetical protein
VVGAKFGQYVIEALNLYEAALRNAALRERRRANVNSQHVWVAVLLERLAVSGWRTRLDGLS